MSFDVHGRAPMCKVGKHFGASSWCWRALWKYTCSVGKDLIDHPMQGHFNDGYGLNDVDTIRLVELLEEEIKSGRAAQYKTKFDKRKNELPDEACDLCEGTGKRKSPLGWGVGSTHCNWCDGKGSRRPNETYYEFDLELLQSFVKFLRECGGFSIR